MSPKALDAQQTLGLSPGFATAPPPPALFPRGFLRRSFGLLGRFDASLSRAVLVCFFVCTAYLTRSLSKGCIWQGLVFSCRFVSNGFF